MANILADSGHIHVVDKSKKKLAAFKTMPKDLAKISLHNKDFLAAKLFDDLDGIFLPYSLHSVPNPIKFLGQAMLSIKANGKILILDYNSRRGNPWIKYPVDIKRLKYLAKQVDLPEPKIIQKSKSRFGRKSYLAEITIPNLRS